MTHVHVHACRVRRRTAPYARFMQATQGPKHASNLMQAISFDKFQPCHWPLVVYIALLALYAVYGPRVWNSLPDELRSPVITLD